MNNPNASENLRPFKPGQSGNPAGRPAGVISQLLRELGEGNLLEFTIVKQKDGETSVSKASIGSGGTKTINELLAARLLQMAIAGDIKAIREVLNRTEGRVPQPINLGGQDDNPLVIDDYTNLSTDELLRRRDALRRRIADEAAGQTGV